jgi:hypothetical protein
MLSLLKQYGYRILPVDHGILPICCRALTCPPLQRKSVFLLILNHQEQEKAKGVDRRPSCQAVPTSLMTALMP